MQLSARRKVSAARSTKSAAPSTKQRHRAIANARERDRTESVNYAFTLLRRLLPTDPPNRKLSKIEVLRLATSYIQHLDNVRTAVFHGDSADNICTRLRHQGNTVGGKVFCTFCVTASKTRQAKSSTENTTSQAQATEINTSAPDWSTQALASYDLVAFTTTATPVDIAALEQPAHGDVIYAQLDNMPVFETVDPPMDPMTTSQVTECINFDWSCADLVDHLNQWNGSFTE